MGAQDGNPAIELNCVRVSVTIHVDWICEKVRGKISWVGQDKVSRVRVVGLRFRIPIRNFGTRTVPKRIARRRNQAMRRELREGHRHMSLYRSHEDASVLTKRGRRLTYLSLRP